MNTFKLGLLLALSTVSCFAFGMQQHIVELEAAGENSENKITTYTKILGAIQGASQDELLALDTYYKTGFAKLKFKADMLKRALSAETKMLSSVEKRKMAEEEAGDAVEKLRVSERAVVKADDAVVQEVQRETEGVVAILKESIERTVALQESVASHVEAKAGYEGALADLNTSKKTLTERLDQKTLECNKALRAVELYKQALANAKKLFEEANS